MNFHKVKLHKFPGRVLQVCIRTYQLTLSPFIGNQCRFYPSCSHYAAAAIEEHGAMREAKPAENEKEIERSSKTQSLLQQFDELDDDLPATKKFMEDPLAAIVSQDDLETLAAIERESKMA